MYRSESNANTVRTKYEWKGMLFILPVLVVLAFLDFYPLGISIFLSLTNRSIAHLFVYQIVGLRNYAAIIGSGELFKILEQTTVWSTGSIVLMAGFGFILALLMNQPGIRGSRIYRTAYLVPWAYPAFITILVWKGLLDYQLGFVNKFLALFGISKIFWLGLPSMAMFSMMLVNLWLSFPYYTYVYTASLQSVPKELYDAARMDGYGTFGVLGNVTLPLLKRQIAFITVFGFVFTWNNFYIPFLLTNGGPGTSTYILVSYTYYEQTALLQYGIASAYAVISVLFLLVFVILINRYTRMMSVLY
ncbi:MAG: sugar ABC transporter permease [Candidatus Thermoplasmatota archaeon]|nr:sugar ABC transporter permease [Candidatus Thermoplasmatota archaeon]